METISISYDSLFDLLRREKSREELQKIEDSFYDDLILFLKAQEKMMFEAPAGADYERIKIQICNVKKILRDLYERRERKVINLATYKVRTATNILDISALLPEERFLFERICQLLSQGRDAILEPVLLGKPTVLDLLNSAVPDASVPGVAVPDVTVSSASAPMVASASGSRRDEDAGNVAGDVAGNVAGNIIDAGNTGNMENVDKGMEPDTGLNMEPKITLKFRIALPEFLGRDMEVYGPFKEGDTAPISRSIAEILIEKKAADYLR